MHLAPLTSHLPSKRPHGPPAASGPASCKFSVTVLVIFCWHARWQVGHGGEGGPGHGHWHRDVCPGSSSAGYGFRLYQPGRRGALAHLGPGLSWGGWPAVAASSFAGRRPARPPSRLQVSPLARSGAAAPRATKPRVTDPAGLTKARAMRECESGPPSQRCLPPRTLIPPRTLTGTIASIVGGSLRERRTGLDAASAATDI
jgi:hypothetical protein